MIPDLLWQIFKFVLSSKKFWMAPLMIFLFFLGILLVGAAGTSFAPFIYAIF